MKQFIDVQYELKDYKKIINKKDIYTWIKKIFKELYIDKSSCSIIFVTIDKILKLNKEYLKKNYPTDVLSFSQIEGEKSNFSVYNFLGDIVICIPYVIENLDKSNNSIKDEIFFLILHGILHLLGYDHEKNKNNKMNNLQNKIFNKLINGKNK